MFFKTLPAPAQRVFARLGREKAIQSFYLAGGSACAFCALLFALLFAACVPSPTATPPRQTPFPTLPLPTDTPLPTATATLAPTALPSPTGSSTPTATFTATRVREATPTNTPAPTATPLHETFAPVVQIFATEAGQAVSINQLVALGIIAADNLGLLRVDLYDEGVLYNSIAAPNPPPRNFAATALWQSEKLGQHRLRAIAYDLAGNASAPDEITVNVLTDNRHPTALISLPVGAVEMPIGAPLLLQGVATDDAAVTRVDLIVDDHLYTYIAPESPRGQSPFPIAFMWIPSDVGAHRLFLRAHDNQEQSGDSSALNVTVYDDSPPALSASVERTNVAVNESLLVRALALAPSGIVRLELWVDNEIVQVVNSAAPRVQTTFEAPLVWVANGSGEHTLFVRAYNRAGLSASTPPRVIRVRPASERAPTNTPPAPTPTPTVTKAPPTATPELALPGLPTIAVKTTGEPLSAQLPTPVRVQLSARAGVELRQVEVWAYYQGDTTPQLLLSESLRGATAKSIEFDWLPPRAGVAFLFARVWDQYNQTGKSPVVSVYIASPPAPTATPAFIKLAPRWEAALPNTKFQATFAQIGRALRGTFINTPATGAPALGTIVAGTVARDRVVFSVDFQRASPSPTLLNFECAYNGETTELACNYDNELGEKGSAVFTPAP